MAVAIPLVMSFAGASTALTVAVTLAAGVTGVAGAINDAASDVFGEDLVKAVNVVGTVFNVAASAGAGAESASGFEGAADNAVSGVDATGSGDLANMAADANTNPLDMRLEQGLAGAQAPDAAMAPNAPIAPDGAMTTGPGDTNTQLAGQAVRDAVDQRGGVLQMIGEGADATGKWWSGLSPTTKQILGYGTMNLVQGYMKGKELKDAAAERERLRQIERTGSGLRYGDNYRYEPADPVKKKG